MSTIIPRAVAKANGSYGDLAPRAEPQENCWPHDRADCPKCLSDEQWLQLMHEATELEHAAALARKNNIFAHPDIERVAAEWDRSASQMRGKLQRLADDEANHAERERGQ